VGKVVPFVLVMALAVAACGGGDGADAGEAIEGFGDAPNDGLGLSALNQAAHRDPEDARSAALDAVDSDDPEVRFAAAYALSLTGIAAGDAEVLRGLLADDDVRIRLLAAQTLAGAGFGDGVPVLISLLASDEPLRDGLRVWEVARRTLLDVTGQDLGLVAATDVEAATATIPAWAQWWDSASETFTPEPRSRVFG